MTGLIGSRNTIMGRRILQNDAEGSIGVERLTSETRSGDVRRLLERGGNLILKKLANRMGEGSFTTNRKELVTITFRSYLRAYLNPG